MTNFENKNVPSQLDTNWQRGAYVKSLIDIESNDPSYQDVDCQGLSLAWFRVESNMAPSQKEEFERQEAMKRQFDLKVINKYGLPYGMPMSKEMKEKINEMEEAQHSKSNKWMRKRQKLIDKQIEKDMKKKRAEEARDTTIVGSILNNTNNSTIIHHNFKK